MAADQVEPMTFRRWISAGTAEWRKTLNRAISTTPQDRSAMFKTLPTGCPCPQPLKEIDRCRLLGRSAGATDHGAQPLQAVCVDLFPQVRWQANRPLNQALRFWLWWAPALVLLLIHGASIRDSETC